MTRGLRAALLGLFTTLFALLGVVNPQPAWAATDSVDSWAIQYAVQPNGRVRATETLVYRFGSSGRQGITRSFVTREAYDDRHDAVYGVENVRVSASDGASAQWQPRTDVDGRNENYTLRIGSAGQYIQTRSVTYTITYEIVGAMRTFSGYDEFSWDAISGETPMVRNITVSVSVPGGVKDVLCSSATPPSKSDCSSARVNGGKAEFTQASKAPGEVLTVAAKIGAGKISDNAPHLTSRADADEVALQKVGMGAGLLSLVVSPLLGMMWWRRRGRDLRYVGLPPGVIPGPGERTPQKPSDDIEIPVAFSPPRISVAEAGLLADGILDTKETTATLVDLAVRGAVKLSSEPGSARVQLVDPSVATRPHEQVLLQRLFGGAGSEEIDLSDQGSMHLAHSALVTSVRNQVASNRWFTAVPSATGASFGCSGVMMLAFAWFFFGGTLSSVLWLLLPVIPLALTVLVVRSKARRGQRTGLGRALTDQVEGFRTYLATAEADQLRFEEGEDIFSRYLPWAILFGLTDRWADLCAQLVRMGRLSAEPPVWYYGPYDHWNFYVFNNSLNTIDHAAAPEIHVPSSVGHSGSGFGGGSSFGGGGGFSGGGGGGGGVGSW
ncbi:MULTISPECIES: DUF2207 domain-containing protein [unclassified Luteococcus]|uniref:DUF2207 domain-containing protein n=1 Tax=unclassified Luteococcus TaxID=2639923 RepID=UPI00313BFFD8